MKLNNLVFVSCLTYNHSAYITDAMDGFCMQKTNFPYVCGILDDASTDGEQDVIYSYVKENFDILCQSDEVQEETEDFIRIVAQNKKNKNCFFVVVFMKYNHYQIKKTKYLYVSDWRDKSKYIAICEGDDYWIDPLKLQKQINHMKSHPDCSLCFTGSKVVFDNGFEKQDIKEYQSLYGNLEERDYDGSEILKDWLIPTASILYKNGISIKTDKRFMFGDIIIALSAADYGDIHCIPEKMVVYRRNSNGMSAKSQPLPRTINHYTAIAEVFGDNNYKAVCHYHIVSSIASSLLTGEMRERKDAIDAIKRSPSYLPQVFLSVVRICFNALKKRIKRS